MEGTTTRSVIIGTNPSHLYQVFSDVEALPRLLKNIQSVDKTGEKTSHWVAEGPAGETVEWDAELTRLEPDKRIAWHAAGKGNIKTSGQVTFNPLPHDQTELTLMLRIVTEEGEQPLDSKTQELVDENLRSLKTSIEEKDV